MNHEFLEWYNAHFPEGTFDSVGKTTEHRAIAQVAWNDSRSSQQTFTQLQVEVHRLAIAKGWWNEHREDGTLLALIHSEVSEALEALRHGDQASTKLVGRSQFAEELADIVIRVMDLAESKHLDLWNVILEKHEYNKGRSLKHGGKQF